MKKTLLGIVAILSVVVSISSCNEDINLTGDFTETAVIYGILDKSDTVHMIKITRAFIGPGSSIDIAQIPDSSYFNSVNATITEYINGVPARVWTLMDTLVDNKDEDGIFYAPQQKLYFFTTNPGSPLLDNATYALDVDLNDGEFQVHGETEIVSGMSTPASPSTYSFKMAQAVGDYKNNGIKINSGNARVINTTLEIGYYEFESAVDSTLEVFNWNLGDKVVSVNENDVIFTTPGELFYSLIGTNIESNLNPSVIQRKLSHIKVTVVGGANDLNEYMTVNQPSSALAQSKPTYTNMTVTNDYRVVGVFSSRQTMVIDKPFWLPLPSSQFIRAIDKNSTAELCTGQYTGPYFFCSQHTVDIANGYSWTCP